MRRNVLFVPIDDLRMQLRHLSPVRGESLDFMHTPHLDGFAARDALSLRNAHVQYALCGPSRNSFMTGRRPDSTHAYGLTTHWRNRGCAECRSLPQLFKEKGYQQDRTCGAPPHRAPSTIGALLIWCTVCGT